VHLNHFATAMTDAGDTFIEAERNRQMQEMERRRAMFRAVRPQARIAGRTVIVTDDGIATGATLTAALRTVRAAQPRETIVAVPVGAADRVAAIRPLCDRVVCLLEPENFWAVGQFYRNFEQVEDERVVDLLRDHGLPANRWAAAAAHA
jgi:predicted phosphoribosyltransferase